MAVHMPSKFILPEKFSDKFDKLSFSSDYESADSMSIPSTPSTPCSPLGDLFDVEIIEEKDRAAVLEFLQTFFFKDEPLNSSLNLINDENPRCIDLENFSLKEFTNGLNLKAVHDNKIVGVSLNGILKKGFIAAADDDSQHEEITDPKFSKIAKLLDFVAEDSDVFQHFPDCDKAMTIKILSVDGSYRGKGIAKFLAVKTRELAKENGCGFMTVDCTSHFSAMAMKRLNFNLTYSKNYTDYKIDGKQVFYPQEPHQAITVYTQRI